MLLKGEIEMNKRFFLYTAILISFIVTFTGCSESKVKLDNIETPTEMTILSYKNKNVDKIKELESQLKDMKKKGVSQEEQNKVSQEQSQLISKNNLIVNDRKFIDKIMNKIIKLEGTKQGLTSEVKDKLLFVIEFPQNTTEKIVSMDQILILSDDTAFIQVPSNLSSIKVKINKNIIKYISDYYNSKV